VDRIRHEGVKVGTRSISAKYVRYVPGKSAAKINRNERERLLRILGLL
jgi:hypothetical protein